MVVLTVKEAAARIGVSISLLYSLCRAGLIRHTRHGRPGRRGTIRISDDAIADYMMACEHEGASAMTAPLNHIR